MFEALSAPLRKIGNAAEDNLWRRKNLHEGQMKKDRVLAYIGATFGVPIADVVTKYNLSHDVVWSNNNNDIVRVGFYADETYSTKICELYMPYSEVAILP